MTFSNSHDLPHSLPLDSVKLSDEALARFFEWMDAQPHASQASRRQHERYAYYCKGLIVTIDQGGYRSRCAVPIRNISNGGIAFLHRAMVHVGRPCQLEIRTPENDWIRTTGKVVRSRYVRRGIYEIGLQFDEEIDAARFKEAPTRSRESDASEASG